MSPKEMTVPPKETNLRLVVLIVALLGTVLALGLGIKWILYLNDSKNKQILEIAQRMQDTQPDQKEKVTDWEQKSRACYVLLLSAVLGIVGAALAYKGLAKPAGIVLVVAGILPLVFTLGALLATAPLLIAGALNFVPQDTEAEPEPTRHKRSLKPHR